MLRTEYLDSKKASKTKADLIKHMCLLGYSNKDIKAKAECSVSYIFKTLSDNTDNWKPDGKSNSWIRKNFRAYVIWIAVALNIRHREIMSYLNVCETTCIKDKHQHPLESVVDLGYSLNGYITKDIVSTNGEKIPLDYVTIRPLDIHNMKTFHLVSHAIECDVDITQLFNSFKLHGRPRI